ncbi:CobW family GTP-binding protein [Rhizobium leguminosarum]|uniref:CobW family GTP-binding protein n=1 Tax=Rhizobium leguminosarum TaxID=384 RepID=UPI001C97A8CA|nr:GTP-binding protein [Rhizobium leguminosarum]MBY5406699.1 hypothetical protein [Rhizobium leguminosarum]
MSETLPEFVLLTGALGSGKTTLLSDYLQSGDVADTGLIINDAGEINVDGAVISADNRDLSMTTLSNGCICCSMGNSVQDGIDALLQARAERRLGPPRRIILETSGLAEPAPILRSLRQVRQMEFRLRVVATYDSFINRPVCGFLPHFAEQLAAAQVIVVTKLDELPLQSWSDTKTTAQSFNPMATLICAADKAERALAAFDAVVPPMPATTSLFRVNEAANHRISTALARWSRLARWDEISDWIEDVSGYLGSRLLRMKGLVHPNGFSQPILVNGVGGVFSSPRPVRGVADEDLGLMMILRDVRPGELDDVAMPINGLELRVK